MSVVPTWMLVYILIYINKLESSETMKIFGEFHLFSNEMNNFFAELNNSIWTLKEYVHIFDAIHNVMAIDITHFKI